MTPLFRAVVVVCTLVATFGCKGSNSANSPVAPGSTTLLGVWTGTVTRPGGSVLSVRWETPNLNDFSLTGPLTLTNSATGGSVTVTGQGNTAGNDRSGYTIHMSLQTDAVFPNCTVRGNTSSPQGGDPFPSPYRSISVPAFSISYFGCEAFLGQNNVQETVQLNLTKQ